MKFDFKNENLKFLNDLLEKSYLFQLNNIEIKREVQFAISPRIDIIIENIIGIEEALKKENSTNLSMHINSLYIHIKGILDNLAEIIYIKLKLKIKNKFHIVLSHQKFKDEIKNKYPELYNLIENSFKIWLADIKSKRDPIAHRKPLYVPFKTITNERELNSFDKINEKLEKQENIENLYSHVIDLQNKLKFKPYFIQYDGSKIYNIEEAVSYDIKKLSSLFEDILEILLSKNNV